MGLAENCLRQLRAEMHLEVDDFVEELLDLTHDHYAESTVEINRNIMKITQDKVLEMEQ